MEAPLKQFDTEPNPEHEEHEQIFRIFGALVRSELDVNEAITRTLNQLDYCSPIQRAHYNELLFDHYQTGEFKKAA